MAMSKLKLESEANIKLRQFADSLKPSEEYHDEGIRLCEGVRKLLEQEVGRARVDFSIAATFYGGSIGKKTDVQEPDFDLVMKINRREPPFTDVLDFFETTLKGHATQLAMDPYSFKRTKYSIQFKFRDGKDVDLLPAMANLTPEETFKLMKGGSGGRRYYSSSLVESQVQFMKVQGPLAHSLARLVKYWYKSMKVGPYVSGGSTIFEIMAVAAILQQRSKGHPDSILEGFKSVIAMVAEIDQIKLEFEQAWGQWRVKEFGGRGAVGKEVPFITEPSNPMNNLLHGINWKALGEIKKCGMVMRTRVQGLTDPERKQFWKPAPVSGLDINFDELFKSPLI